MLELEQVAADLDALSRDGFAADPVDMARGALALLTPPEQISTTDCAARYRYIPLPEGEGKVLWSPTLTPYINGIQDAGDDPRTNLIIVPKPGRVGGTIAAENMLFKRLKFGPLTDTLWYLGSESEVDSYIDRTVAKLFELHPDIQAKVGRGRSDDKRTFKRVAGRILEYLQVNNRTITGRTGGFIVGDEIDAIARKLRPTFVDQAFIRGTTLGSRFKGYLCSHMDAGWTGGIAAAWKESSRGIWFWPCPHCRCFGSPCPTAPKDRHMRLEYDRPDGVDDDELFDAVAASAGLLCPSCGTVIRNEHKAEMNAAGVWVHEGQTIGADGTVTGEPRNRRVMGFWIHGSMSPWVSWGDLARRYVSALLHYERTRKPERLREVSAKVLGEVYGAAGTGFALEPHNLANRGDDETRFALGTVPAEVMFVTASVDVGGAKFDVGIWGWDLEGRSWLIDRLTLKQRTWRDGRARDLRPPERIEDWDLIRTEVLDRILPLAGDPTRGLPVAAVAIDSGDGNVTWKAREFARRMARAGSCWGSGAGRWERVRLIKGAKSPSATELPAKGREISVDEQGKPVVPTVLEWDLGVFKLKSQAVERLAVTDGGPGQCSFADGLPRSAFAEFTGEVLIDGAWERRGPNESLDLFGYAEAVRLMLRPDRADIRWEPVDRRPVWARPVPLIAVTLTDDDRSALRPVAKPAPTQRAPTARDRLAAVNRKR